MITRNVIVIVRVILVSPIKFKHLLVAHVLRVTQIFKPIRISSIELQTSVGKSANVKTFI